MLKIVSASVTTTGRTVRIVAAAPGIVIVDEAYGEFSAAPSAITLIDRMGSGAYLTIFAGSAAGLLVLGVIAGLATASAPATAASAPVVVVGTSCSSEAARVAATVVRMPPPS